MGRFKKGLVFGGALGAGLTWLMTTAKGKEVREQILDASADIYVKLRKQIIASESYEKLTKKRYVQLLTKAVKEYAKTHKLPEDLVSVITRILSTQWKKIRSELK